MVHIYEWRLQRKENSTSDEVLFSLEAPPGYSLDEDSFALLLTSELDATAARM